MKYLDSSAFVKYYSQEYHEKGYTKIKELVNNAKDKKEIILSSIILIPETISAFDKWKRLKLLNEEDFDELLGIFINDLKELSNKSAVILESINNFTVFFSIDSIIKHSLSFNDALHLYNALLNKDKITQFISSDKNLCKAAKAEGLNVFNPEENGKN